MPSGSKYDWGTGSLLGIGGKGYRGRRPMFHRYLDQILLEQECCECWVVDAFGDEPELDILNLPGIIDMGYEPLVVWNCTANCYRYIQFDTQSSSPKRQHSFIERQDRMITQVT